MTIFSFFLWKITRYLSIYLSIYLFFSSSLEHKWITGSQSERNIHATVSEQLKKNFAKSRWRVSTLLYILYNFAKSRWRVSTLLYILYNFAKFLWSVILLFSIIVLYLTLICKSIFLFFVFLLQSYFSLKLFIFWLRVTVGKG